MKKSIRFFLVITALLITSVQSYSQGTNQASNTISLGMPEVLLLKSNTPSINLTLSPQEAGQAVEQSKSDSTARILISSVVAGSQTRNLSASVTSGAVPPGTFLKVIAMTPNNAFVGTMGSLGSEVELDATSKNVITGIGTCYSGTASDDGYVLKYTFGVLTAQGSYELIRASAGTEVTVTLTLSAGV